MVFNSRAKGASFERDVAKILKKWWTVEPDSKFIRTPGSGAFGTRNQTSSVTVRGDIIVDNPGGTRWPWSVECKNVRTITDGAINNFKLRRKSSIDKYWKQCLEGAKGDRLDPLLVFRGLRMDPWCAFYDKFVDENNPEFTVAPLEYLLNQPPELYAKPLVVVSPVGADR